MKSAYRRARLAGVLFLGAENPGLLQTNGEGARRLHRHVGIGEKSLASET